MVTLHLAPFWPVHNEKISCGGALVQPVVIEWYISSYQTTRTRRTRGLILQSVDIVKQRYRVIGSVLYQFLVSVIGFIDVGYRYCSPSDKEDNHFRHYHVDTPTIRQENYISSNSRQDSMSSREERTGFKFLRPTRDDNDKWAATRYTWRSGRQRGKAIRDKQDERQGEEVRGWFGQTGG